MNLKPYQGLFFDFDYTLANSEAGILKCFHATFKYFQLPPLTDEAIKATIGLPLLQAFALLAHKQDKEFLAKMAVQYTAYADQWMTSHTKLFPGIKELLIKLHQEGKILGIISNKTASRIKQTLEQEGLTPYITLVLGSDTLEFPKPNPLGLNTALATTNLTPEKVIYFGDHLVDAEFALNAHVNFIPVLTGNTPATAFKTHPHLCILDKLTDLLKT